MQDGDRAVAVLPVLPWVGAALLLVLLVALNVPAPPAGRRALARVPGSYSAHLPVAVAGLVVAALLTAVARFGPRDELDNPVPALVVGLGWPVLFVGPLLWGLARRPAARTNDSPGAPRDTRPAVVAAAVVVGYLALAPSPSSPRSLAVALPVYVVVLAAVAVALGRDVAARTEVLGLLARWSALGPRLVRWHPPRGAAAVLAVVMAGAWAERVGRSMAWADTGAGRLAEAAMLVACVAVAGLAAVALTSWSDGRAAPVLLPLAVAAVVAGVLRRAAISAQLLWDQAGAGSPGVDPDPFGVAGGQAAALAVAAAGGALAATVLARRVPGGSARLPGVGVVLAVTAMTGWVTLTV